MATELRPYSEQADIFLRQAVEELERGDLQFGRWQSVFFVELDGPSRREVIMQILGE